MHRVLCCAQAVLCTDRNVCAPGGSDIPVCAEFKSLSPISGFHAVHRQECLCSWWHRHSCLCGIHSFSDRSPFHGPRSKDPPMANVISPRKREPFWGVSIYTGRNACAPMLVAGNLQRKQSRQHWLSIIQLRIKSG